MSPVQAPFLRDAEDPPPTATEAELQNVSGSPHCYPAASDFSVIRPLFGHTIGGPDRENYDDVRPPAMAARMDPRACIRSVAFLEFLSALVLLHRRSKLARTRTAHACYRERHAWLCPIA